MRGRTATRATGRGVRLDQVALTHARPKSSFGALAFDTECVRVPQKLCNGRASELALSYALSDMAKNVIHWFRKGLRLHDNPALLEALSPPGAARLYPCEWLYGLC
jgi:hypothetical protein